MHDNLQRAVELRNAQRYDEARVIFEALIAQHPDDTLVNYHFAWLHDNLGLEREAVPFYERAIAGDLPDDDLRGALLGLGSTYRALGEYEKSASTLRRGMTQFPDAHEFAVFLSMTLYNLGQHAEAMALLLNALTETSADSGIKRYAKAIAFYSDKLDQTWT